MIKSFILLTLFSFSIFSQINSQLICENESNFSSSFQKAITLTEKNKILNAKYDFLKSITFDIYTEYISNRISFFPEKNIFEVLGLECLSSDDQNELNQMLHSVFKEKTLDLIKSFGPKNKIFAELIESNKGQYFKLLGHYNEAAPNDKKAGFHRGNRSIFMNILKIPTNEWPIIFAHEHLHSLDIEMLKSVEEFSNQDLIKKLVTKAIAVPDLNFWSTEEKHQLHEWLTHGLNRGFLGEYRTWTMTLILYQEALMNQRIQKIPWIEKILANKPSHQKLDHYLLTYLSKKWTNPTNFPFDLKPISNSLIEIRKELLQEKYLPQLGTHFEAILSGKGANLNP